MELQFGWLQAVLCLALLSTLVRALPVDDAKRAAKDQARVYHQYDSDDSPAFLDESKAEDCTMAVNNTYNVSETAYDFETGEYTTTVVEVTTTSYVCCEGWSGDDCDVPPGTNPCGKLTCEEDPRARCALIKRCGIEIPLFVNDMGRVIKNCLPEEHLCTGICKTDPCNGLSCEHYPEAMCFTSGCSCEPVWLLPSKVRVSDCSIDPATKRNVRQVPKQCQS